MEWLCEVVVGPDVETFDLVFDCVTCRNGDDARSRPDRAKGFYEIESNSIGQIDIDDNTIVVIQVDLLGGFVVGVHYFRQEAVFAQVAGDAIGQYFFVLYDQNFHASKLGSKTGKNWEFEFIPVFSAIGLNSKMFPDSCLRIVV